MKIGLMRRLSANSALLVILVMISGTGLGIWRYQHQRYKHFEIHEPGMLYRSAWLEPDVMAELVETYQLRTVVNLCRPGEMGTERWDAEQMAVLGAGARPIALPLQMTVDPTAPQIRQCLEVLGNPDNYPMLVHCQHGVTRTAKFLAIYDMAYRNMSSEESLAHMPLLGRDEHNVHLRAFARQFADRHHELYETARPERLSVLR